MDTAPAPTETSSAANVEMNSTTPDTSSMGDWASRIDNEIDSINKDTGATKYGKVDSEKSEKPAKTEKVVEKSVKEPTEEADERPEVAEKEVPQKEETPKGLTEKAAVKWGELRAEAAKAKEYAKEVETLKAEVEKLKTTAPDTTELDRLRQINAEYEQELSVARVEATQEYKSNVVEPMVNVVSYLNGLAERYELNSKEMLAAFAESDSAKQSDLIADLAANMNERDRLRLYAAADDYSEIIRRRDYYQSSSRDRMAQIEQQRQAALAQQQNEQQQTAAQYKEAYTKATDKVFNDLKKSVPVLSDEEVASDVQRLAKQDYSNADPELKSYLAHSGALLPHVLKALKAAKAELEEANKKIVGYRNGSPKAGSGSSDMSRSLPEDVGFLDALERQLS